MTGKVLMDVLLDDGGFHVFETERVDTIHTHGTGCTMASAIAAGLAQDMPLPAAVERAQAYVAAAIRGALGTGRGMAPLTTPTR